MKQTEVPIELNANELDIILSALKLIDNGDEIQINRQFGSVSTLHDRLYNYYNQLEKTNIEFNYHEPFIEPSF